MIATSQTKASAVRIVGQLFTAFSYRLMHLTSSVLGLRLSNLGIKVDAEKGMRNLAIFG